MISWYISGVLKIFPGAKLQQCGREVET